MKIFFKYLQIAKTAFLARSFYRFELLFDILKAITVVLVITAIWKSIYNDTAYIEKYSYSDIVTYTCVATALTMLFNVDLSHYLSRKINSGSIAMDFIKPVNHFLYYFSEHLGSVIYSMLFGVVPAMFAFVLIFDLKADSTANLPGIFLLVTAGFLLYYMFCHLVALSTFYTIDAWGIEYFRVNMIRFFAGGFIPLSFFPESFTAINNFLPFQYMIYAPTAAIAGKLPSSGFAGAVIMQFAWIAVLFVLDQLIWKFAIKRVTVHGG